MIRLLRKFWRQTDGAVVFEGLFGSLLLLGWYAIAFQFYDVFRMRAQVLRASYTVADLISRERNAIGPTYVTGLKKVFDYISNTSDSDGTWLRLTLISCSAQTSDNCDGVSKAFTLAAPSYTTATSGVSVHTTTSINAEHERIPILAPGDMAVVLESSYPYFPILDIGDMALLLDGETWTQQGLSSKLRFSNFVVTRPRGPQTVWNSTK
ncbi:hypothetical protein [Rhodobacter maris]|uniref:Flp pilus assembly protein TadG n=1 Tax=Rhodobacter maris TaxID=446682 RepID=A0A285S4Y4_9RHOB|nr:hypothetical protein [Rhodobacter maris]SOC02216.1 Flp pilus assembly protein TadG [Rhodobacter maris]